MEGNYFIIVECDWASGIGATFCSDCFCLEYNFIIPPTKVNKRIRMKDNVLWAIVPISTLLNIHYCSSCKKEINGNNFPL